MAHGDWRGVRLVATGLMFLLLFNGALSLQAVAQTLPAPPGDGAGKPVVTLLNTTRWQPVGGEFHFTITGNPEQLAACLGWEPSVITPCPASSSLTVRRVVISSATPPVVTFAAALPSDLTPPDAAKPYYSFMPVSVFTAAYVTVSATNTARSSSLSASRGPGMPVW